MIIAQKDSFYKYKIQNISVLAVLGDFPHWLWDYLWLNTTEETFSSAVPKTNFCLSKPDVDTLWKCSHSWNNNNGMPLRSKQTSQVCGRGSRWQIFIFLTWLCVNSPGMITGLSAAASWSSFDHVTNYIIFVKLTQVPSSPRRYYWLNHKMYYLT